jgi:hypothetical protein
MTESNDGTRTAEKQNSDPGESGNATGEDRKEEEQWKAHNFREECFC